MQQIVEIRQYVAKVLVGPYLCGRDFCNLLSPSNNMLHTHPVPFHEEEAARRSVSGSLRGISEAKSPLKPIQITVDFDHPFSIIRR